MEKWTWMKWGARGFLLNALLYLGTELIAAIGTVYPIILWQLITAYTYRKN